MKPIKNLIFDLGGVIINIDHRRTAQAFENHGVRDFLKRFSLLKQHPIFDKAETGAITPEEFRVGLCRELEIELKPDHFDEAWNEILIDIPAHRLELLKKVSKTHRVFILSNTNHIHLRWIDQYLARVHRSPVLGELVEKAYYSFEMGMRKPDQIIFKTVLKDSELDPSETLFIDDSLPNIESAASLGIRTLHHDSTSEIEPVLLKLL